jgi:hypothetical protein
VLQVPLQLQFDPFCKFNCKMTSQEELLFKAISELDPDQAKQQLYETRLQELHNSVSTQVAATTQQSNKVDGTLVKVLQARLKPYKGHRNVQAIRTYILRLEEYFQAASNLTPEAQLLVASTYLELNAEVWWQSHLKSHPKGLPGKITTWNQFKIALRDHFLPANAMRSARDQLAKLKQLGSVQDYLTRFNSLCLEVDDLSEAEKLDKFIRGLKPKVQEQLELNPSSTINLVTAAATADRIDQIQFNYTKKHQNYDKKLRPYITVHQPSDVVPMDIDNMSIQPQQKLAKLSDAEKTELRKKGACFRCRQPGHIAPHCPLKKQQGNGKKTQ